MIEIFAAYLSGIIASFTPCMVALYPLLFFRLSKEKRVKRTLFLIALGFIMIFSILALFLSQIDFEKIRFGFGLMLVFLGLAGILRIMPNISTTLNTLNPFIFGVSMAIVFSTNPCSLPFLLTILSGGVTFNLNVVLLLLVFSVGLLTPIFVFALLGNIAITHTIIKYSSKIDYVEKFLNLILIATGAYLIFSIHNLNMTSLYLSSALILITFIGIAYFLFPDIKKEPFVIFTFISLILLLTAFIFHCKEFVSEVGTTTEKVCSYTIEKCDSCMTCSYLFLTATLFGVGALYLRYYRKCSFLKRIKIKIEW